MCFLMVMIWKKWLICLILKLNDKSAHQKQNSFWCLNSVLRLFFFVIWHWDYDWNWNIQSVHVYSCCPSHELHCVMCFWVLEVSLALVFCLDHILGKSSPFYLLHIFYGQLFNSKLSEQRRRLGFKTLDLDSMGD